MYCIRGFVEGDERYLWAGWDYRNTEGEAWLCDHFRGKGYSFETYNAALENIKLIKEDLARSSVKFREIRVEKLALPPFEDTNMRHCTSRPIGEDELEKASEDQVTASIQVDDSSCEGGGEPEDRILVKSVVRTSEIAALFLYECGTVRVSLKSGKTFEMNFDEYQKALDYYMDRKFNF